MRAFASNWTRPYVMQHPGEPYDIPDFELFSTILSALLWRQKNGSICMITDRLGERYYRSLGLSNLWDDGLFCRLDRIPYTIDPSTFWAAGKLFALSEMPAPCVMIDTDFIVWNNIQDLLASSQLTVIHREDLFPDIYPDPDCFVLDSRYTFPQDWDWCTPACNTAFTYFGNDDLRRTYTTQAFEFINAVRARDGLIYMVFAEQRLLGMCAAAQHISVDALSSPEQLFSPKQLNFTHIWGYKQTMLENPAARRHFCLRCAARVIRDFPEYQKICAAIPSLQPYFSDG